MTIRIAIKLQDGLEGIADTRVTAGVEHITTTDVDFPTDPVLYRGSLYKNDDLYRLCESWQARLH
jgi:hypothetical protein